MVVVEEVGGLSWAGGWKEGSFLYRLLRRNLPGWVGGWMGWVEDEKEGGWVGGRRYVPFPSIEPERARVRGGGGEMEERGGLPFVVPVGFWLRRWVGGWVNRFIICCLLWVGGWKKRRVGGRAYHLNDLGHVS